MRARILAGGAAVILAAAGCSANSSGGTTAAASPTDTPPAASAAPTTPAAAICTAARALITRAQPTFSADATADTVKQSGDDSAFYTQLLQVFSENGGADPLSIPVAADAQKLAADYGALLLAAQQSDLDGQNTALKSLVTDIGQMTKDQVPFDQACGIPAIVPS
jgi:hypothetical protein